MHASTPTYSLLIALALPACVLDTKLIDNPSDSDSDSDGGTLVTGDDSTTEDMPTTTAPTSDPTSETGEPVDPACSLLPDKYFEWVVASIDDPTWAPIDESCTVTATTALDQLLELRFDCPQHAAEHGEFKLALVGEPFPALVPQPGDIVDVYFRPRVEDPADPHPQMVFLRSGGELLYAATIGSFVDPNDVAVAAARYAPLTVSIEPGPCELAANPSFGEPPDPGFEATLASTCEQHAFARLHVGSPDDETKMLDGFMSDEIAVGTRTYTIQALSALRGAACGDLADLEWSASAIAVKSAP